MTGVRDALPDDAAAIAVVQVETWRSAYAGLMADAVLAGLSVPSSEARYREVLPRTAPNLCLVAGSPVCGFVSAGPSWEDATAGQVYAIYVHPSAQGRGLGRALLGAACARLVASGFTDACLWVLTTNAPSRAFYESQGWAADGAEKLETLRGAELHETRYVRSLT